MFSDLQALPRLFKHIVARPRLLRFGQRRLHAAANEGQDRVRVGAQFRGGGMRADVLPLPLAKQEVMRGDQMS